MSAPNSGMAIHTLVLIVDRFSLHCNSIQSPVSIVHLRVILTYLIPLLRVYINQHSSNAIQSTSSMYSKVTTSTRINILQCTYVHHIVCSTLRVSSNRIYILFDLPATFSNGLLTNNSTEMPGPQNTGHLQSLVGMVRYLSPFILQLSSHTETVRGLLKTDVE